MHPSLTDFKIKRSQLTSDNYSMMIMDKIQVSLEVNSAATEISPTTVHTESEGAVAISPSVSDG